MSVDFKPRDGFRRGFGVSSWQLVAIRIDTPVIYAGVVVEVVTPAAAADDFWCDYLQRLERRCEAEIERLKEGLKSLRSEKRIRDISVFTLIL